MKVCKVLLAGAMLTACGKKSETIEDLGKGTPPMAIHLEPISELNQSIEDNAGPQPVLIGGRVADPKDWPASMYADMGGARCTATVVGEKVLFIAAHCVASGGTASFRVGTENYTSKCTHSKDYAGNATADYALCEIDRPVTAIPFENVNQNDELVKIGAEVLLTGFGCTQPGGGGGNDGKYRIGEARVTQVPSGTNNDIVTFGSALCYGDSGGPAFMYLDAQKTKRTQLSINSRGNIKDTSYLSSVSTTAGKRFIKAWSELTSLKICGVHADAKGCRGAGVNPIPEPTKCREAYDKVGACMKDQIMKTDESCWRSYAFLFQCMDRTATQAGPHYK